MSSRSTGGGRVSDITFSTWELRPGVHLHVAPTEKFKTVRIRVALETPLAQDTATANALVPMVLRRGSQRYPTLRDIARHLESLYGSAFGFDTRKIGESQIIEAHYHVPSERFLPGADGLLRASVEFLAETLLRPLRTADGAFLPEYVQSERESLRQRIDGLVDERMQYAVQRCYANMCRDEPFGIYRYGRSEDLSHIDPAGLYARYERLIGESRVHIIVVGAVDPEKTRELFAAGFPIPRDGLVDIPAPAVAQPDSVRTVVERLDVLQGVLVLGCRLPVRYADDAYPALLMYNGVLGGFSHSKLFMEVRERASLAYTAFSRMDTVKGVQILFAGIDVGKFEQARDIMLRQLDDVREGKVTDSELEATRKALVNGLRSGLDDPGQIIHARLLGAVGGRQWGVDELVAAVEDVTRDDIAEVARGVALDTVYFLRDHAGEDEGHAD